MVKHYFWYLFMQEKQNVDMIWKIISNFFKKRLAFCVFPYYDMNREF
jgi:hypothetical protein